MGELLGSMLGGGAGSGGGLGDLVGMAMNQFGAAQRGEPARARAEVERALPSGVRYAQVEQQAELLIKAMINAAKSDGRVDVTEQQKIVDRLEVSADEIAFSSVNSRRRSTSMVSPAVSRAA